MLRAVLCRGPGQGQAVTGRVALVTGAARGIGAATVAALAARRLARWSRWTGAPTTRRCRTRWDRGPNLTRWSRRFPRRWPSRPTWDPDALAAAAALGAGALGRAGRGGRGRGVIAGGVPRLAGAARAGARRCSTSTSAAVLNLARVAVCIACSAAGAAPPAGSSAVASAAATRGLPMLAAYCAAKAGVTGFVRALAAELGGTGVTANAVSPGPTQTSILDESARLYGLPAARAPSPPSSRWVGWCPRPRWPRSSRSWPGTAPAP